MSVSTLLAIDTSGPRLQLALVGRDLAQTYVEEVARGHAEILFTRLSAFLEQNALKFGDLTRIAVATGPGSFTGLRIGIAAARGFALALDIELVGIPNLLALSLGDVAENNQPLAVILDARRGEAYAQKFSAPGCPVDEAVVLPTAEAEAQYFSPDCPVIVDPHLDIALLAKFACGVKAADYLPLPAYIRAADAKPQTRMRIARK